MFKHKNGVFSVTESVAVITGDEEKHEEESTDNQEEESQTSNCTDNTEHAPNCPGWKDMGYCEPG